MKRVIAILILAFIVLSISFSTMPTAKPKIPKGAYGVWQVASIKTTSPLYKSEYNDSKHNQKVVDKENGALWWAYSKGHAIVDHAYSEVGDGVWCVNEMHVGDIGTLTTSKTTTYYECTAIWKATQTRYVYKYDGTTISVKKGDIICVCCADEDGYNYVAYFRRAA